MASVSEYTHSGYYDYERYVVLLASLDDPGAVDVTLQHEYLHHFLTMTTGQGLVMNRVRSQHEGGEALAFLHETCQLVQEANAVFGSIREIKKQDLKQDLLSRMPKEYHSYYTKMADLVDPVFDTTLLAMMFATSIARVCMMNRLLRRCEESDDYSMDFLKRTLPEHDWPDRRFEAIIENRHLITRAEVDKLLDAAWPSEDRSLLYYEDFRALRSHFGADDGRYDKTIGKISRALMDVLCELLKPLYADLEDDFSKWRFHWLLKKYSSGSGAERSMFFDFPSAEGILHKLEQTVAVHDKSITQVLSGLKRSTGMPQADEVRKVISRAMARDGTVHLYASVPSEASSLCVSLMHTELGIIYSYDLSPARRERPSASRSASGLDVFDGFSGAITAVLENDSYRAWLKCRQEWRGLLPGVVETALNRALVHYKQTPKKLMTELIYSKDVTRVTRLNFSYVAGQFAGVLMELCLYEIEGRDDLLFHLSNTFMSEGIYQLVAMIGEPHRVTWDDDLARRNSDRIGKLIDHPVMTYYLAGEAPDMLF